MIHSVTHKRSDERVKLKESAGFENRTEAYSASTWRKFMAKIVFFMYPQEGHLLPTFRIARSLQAQGHQIYYISVLDFETFIQAQGFQFIPILSHSFPKGTREQQAIVSLNQDAYLKKIGGIRSRLARISFIRKWYMLDRVIVGQRFQQELSSMALKQDNLQTLIKELEADLFIIDTFLPAVVLIVYQLGIRYLSLNITGNLHNSKGELLPPSSSPLIPEHTFSYSVKVRLIWWSNLWGRDVMFWLIKYNFDENIRKLAHLCNYPSKNIERTIFYPHILPDSQRPELVCFSKDLDFPRSEREGIYYIESMDLQRQEAAFPWDRVVSEMPLLYCALGSRVHAYTGSQRFYQTIIDALAQRPDWQAIIAIGSQLRIEDFHAIPPNVLLVNWVPQLEVLQRASIMITHGGLGTVKECIYYGVPMMTFPVMGDQPGNAARVVYHGLGVMGSFRTASIQQVLSLLEIIEKDPSFKKRVEEMASKLRKVENSQTGLQVIKANLPRYNL
jgi:zeaxanthin glucosyltransferase